MSTETSTLVESQPTTDYDTFTSSTVNRSWISIGLAIVLLIVAAVVRGTNIWTSLLFTIIGLTQLIVAGLMIIRIRSRNQLQRAGNVVVQHSWVLLSISIAALALYPSPFFEVSMLWFAVAIITGLGWAIISIYNIYRSRRDANARLTV